MENKKFWFGDCPFCSLPYMVYEEHFATFKRCNKCKGSLRVGETYIDKDNLNKVQLLPDLKGESFSIDGFTVKEGVLIKAAKETDEIKIPTGTISIGEGVFLGFKTVKKVYIPEGVKFIEANAFRDCEGLRELHLPKSLIAMGNYAFRNCRRLNEVIIPESLKFAGYGIFQGCDNLIELNLPMDMEFLGGSAYRYCKKLQRSTIPNCVSDISLWFTDLFALEELVVSERVEDCDSFPAKRLKKLTFIRKNGWCLQKGYWGESKPVDPLEISTPEKTALLLYRAKKQKLRLVNTEVEQVDKFSIHHIPITD